MEDFITIDCKIWNNLISNDTYFGMSYDDSQIVLMNKNKSIPILIKKTKQTIKWHMNACPFFKYAQHEDADIKSKMMIADAIFNKTNCDKIMKFIEQEQISLMEHQTCFTCHKYIRDDTDD